MDEKPQPLKKRNPVTIGAIVVAVVLGLIGSGYLIARYIDWHEATDVNESNLDEIVIALREQRNRLEVYRISGTVTTVQDAQGCWWNICSGTLKVRQPWSVAYFGDMGDISLADYIWDERTRTLMVRAPAIRPDPPNIDESRQIVAYEGPIITRDMQTRLRAGIARTAVKQASTKAATPENLAAAESAARERIASNLQGPLRAIGMNDVRIEVLPRVANGDGERWDVSRSIAEVLAERAGRR